MRRRRAEDLARMPADGEHPHLAILLPLHCEQLVIRQLVEHFREADYPRDRLRVVFITTEKEQSAGGRTTEEVLRGLLAEDRPPHFLHLHYPRKHRFRADQLNFAIGEVCSSWPERESYIAVYNADSLPDPDTFRLLAADSTTEKRRNGELPPAYQQGVRYFVPARYARRMVAHTVAALQSVYTCAHLLRRIDNSRPGDGTPVTFTGHGEFIRLDVVKSVGMFPNYAYADGLLMGWEVAFAGNAIRLLPAFDRCEVPQGILATVRQHKAWFLGLLNLTAAVRHCFGGLLPIRDRRLGKFVVLRMLATLSWGFRSVFFALLLIEGAWSGGAWFVAAATGIAIFGISPLIYADLMWPEIATVAPGEKRGGGFIGQICAAIPALLIDGCGFWPALGMWLFAGAAPPMPPSTKR